MSFIVLVLSPASAGRYSYSYSSMNFGFVMFYHEKLDVYCVSLDFVEWAYRICRTLSGPDRHARDQLLRASQSIPLNIAEGNGKRPSADRRRFLHIAYGSALECAAIIDILIRCKAVENEKGEKGKQLLARIAAMLIKMTSVGREIREPVAAYEGGGLSELFCSE